MFCSVVSAERRQFVSPCQGPRRLPPNQPSKVESSAFLCVSASLREILHFGPAARRVVKGGVSPRGPICLVASLRVPTVLCMARSLRIHYPGAIYHVMNRGDRREDIFLDDRDRRCSEGLKLLWANQRIKVCLAQRLRREATMNLRWIAGKLGIGSWKYLSNLLSKELHASGTTQFNQ